MLLEAFTTLLHDPLLFGAVEILVTDALIGLLVWPIIKRHFIIDNTLELVLVAEHLHGDIDIIDDRNKETITCLADIAELLHDRGLCADWCPFDEAD